MVVLGQCFLHFVFVFCRFFDFALSGCHACQPFMCPYSHQCHGLNFEASKPSWQHWTCIDTWIHKCSKQTNHLKFAVSKSMHFDQHHHRQQHGHHHYRCMQHCVTQFFVHIFKTSTYFSDNWRCFDICFEFLCLFEELWLMPNWFQSKSQKHLLLFLIIS